MDSLYEILGVRTDASDEEIKAAYRKRSKETHPDVNAGDSTDFSKISEAYAILSDKKSRLTYDATGSKKARTEDSKLVDAIRELQRVMCQILDESDDSIFYMDLPAHVLNIFNANILKSKNTIVDYRKAIKRLRRYKKRFHYKDKDKDNNDFISYGINGKIYALTGAITIEVEKIRSFELMLKLLASYDYEPEEQPRVFGLKT